MTDIVSPETRSRMMAGIRCKNTKPEMIVRRELHRRGFRYRIHAAKLPGKPDLVFPSRHAVIRVHGCFWHGHDCPLFRMPQSRREFWQQKIDRNRARDAEVLDELLLTGWRVMTVWECALKGSLRKSPEEVADICAAWLEDSGKQTGEIAGGCRKGT
jgi:DNA mismatch endonuclease, patch repair protein